MASLLWGGKQRCHQAPGRSLASHLDDLHSVLHGGLPAACAGAFHVVVWCLPACHTTAQPYALVSRESEFYRLYPRFYLGTEMEFGSPHGPPFCHLLFGLCYGKSGKSSATNGLNAWWRPCWHWQVLPFSSNNPFIISPLTCGVTFWGLRLPFCGLITAVSAGISGNTFPVLSSMDITS